MAEEQRYEQSSAPTLCVNGCGFFGNPTTMNLCSKCHRDLRLKETQIGALLTPAASVKSSSSSSPSVSVAVAPLAVGSVPETTPSGPSRCGTCRKRMGLTGFKCKCGAMYCGTHRYPEQHSCTFDFKELGKEAIAKANPVIKAAKLDNKI